MARLQILELPTEHHGDDTITPFVLVIDQHQPLRYLTGLDMGSRSVNEFEGIAEEIGARAVLVFMETVEIPANEGADSVSVRLTEERDELHAEIGLAQGQLHSAALSAIRGKHATIRELIERAEQAEAERDEARRWARHGYEIGQKHCGWSDHGVAPTWLTEGWPRAFDSCEHLQQMAVFDEVLTRVRNLPTEPEVMNAQQEHPDVWLHGYKCGVLAARSAARPRGEVTTKP